jgi:hypothetical protein
VLGDLDFRKVETMKKEIRVKEEELLHEIISENSNKSQYEKMNRIIDLKYEMDLLRGDIKSKMSAYETFKKEKKNTCDKILQVFNEINELYFGMYGIVLNQNIFREMIFDQISLHEDKAVSKMLNFYLHSFRREDKAVVRERYLFEEGEGDIVEAIRRYKFDHTIISINDDIINEIEKKVKVKKVISAGSWENDKEIVKLLEGDGDEIYLIKNIHFLGNIKKKGNNNFIFTTEWGEKKHPLLEQSRVIFYEKESSLEVVTKSVRGGIDPGLICDEVEWIINFYSYLVYIGGFVPFSLERDYEFWMRDLLGCLMVVKEDMSVIDQCMECIFTSRVDREDRRIIVNLIEYFKKNKEMKDPRRPHYEVVPVNYKIGEDVKLVSSIERKTGAYKLMRGKIEGGAVFVSESDTVYDLEVSQCSEKDKKGGFIWCIKGNTVFKVWANGMEDAWYRFIMVSS